MRILAVVMSCIKHKHLWEKLTSIHKDVIIFTGSDKNENYYDEKYRVLHLKCNDNYDGLPEKVILMIQQILSLKQFSNVSHIIKIDDHDNYFTAQNLENLYHLNEVHKYHYIGQKLNTQISSTYHYGKVPDGSYWANKPYEGKSKPWLDGGNSYILTRKAMIYINHCYNSRNIEKLRKKEIYEDLMIAKVLHKFKIYPKCINYNIIGDKS